MRRVCQFCTAPFGEKPGPDGATYGICPVCIAAWRYLIALPQDEFEETAALAGGPGCVAARTEILFAGLRLAEVPVRVAPPPAFGVLVRPGWAGRVTKLDEFRGMDEDGPEVLLHVGECGGVYASGLAPCGRLDEVLTRVGVAA